MTVHDATRIGFGDPENPQRFVPLHIEISSGVDVYPDWVPEPNRTIRQIAGSNDFDVYVGGFGPSRITLSIWCDTRSEYQRLRAMYLRNISGTLVLLAGFTSHDGHVRTHDAVSYEQFPNTLIDAITQPMLRIGGTVECVITFMRAESVPAW